MRACIAKKGTSAQTFQLLLWDVLSVELLLLLLLLDCSNLGRNLTCSAVPMTP